MRILLTKVSDLRHRLQVIRDDGSTEAAELDSRSFLVHDFIHYAVESGAGLTQSFWGPLAGGKSLAELAAVMQPDAERPQAAVMASEAAVTEAVVGVLTGVALGRATAGEALDGIGRLFEAHQRPLPAWLTPAFVAAAMETIRRLRGAWRAVPYRGTMELSFPPASATQATLAPRPKSG